jgi:putative transposase
MNLHLAAISATSAPGRHAVLLLDQAGWHVTPKLIVPDNISILPLSAKCPELNPQEDIWQFMRDNWLSNRVFTCYDNLVDHCSDAWNRLVQQPWTIMSISLRDWSAHRCPRSRYLRAERALHRRQEGLDPERPKQTPPWASRSCSGSCSRTTSKGEIPSRI